LALPAIPQDYFVQTANRQNLISWSQASGATSYQVERSLDNITYTLITTLSGSPLATSYLDTAVTVGTQYWYRVRSVNVDGNSPYTQPQTVVPAPTAEKSLGAIRLESQQKADRVNSKFVTKPEWNTFINLAMYELYDLLITVYEDYNVAQPIQFTTNGSQYQYELPNGANQFLDANNVNAGLFTPKPFYKLLGVDLALQNTTNQGYVTINKFNFIDRNRFVYPNTASTIYGVFNMQYRVMGSKLTFIPTPSASQAIRVWYIPRLTELLADTDLSDVSISGWIQYVIVRAAKYALDKEESDTTKLDQELMYLKQRIEESASNRDAGSPDTISATRSGASIWGSGQGPGWNGSSGGA
jgi:hypothetical protein